MRDDMISIFQEFFDCKATILLLEHFTTMKEFGYTMPELVEILKVDDAEMLKAINILMRYDILMISNNSLLSINQKSPIFISFEKLNWEIVNKYYELDKTDKY